MGKYVRRSENDGDLPHWPSVAVDLANRWLTPGITASPKKPGGHLSKTMEVRQVTDCCEALFNNGSVLSRFDDTGIPHQDALALGLTGVTAKSSGIFTDARMDYPLSDEISFTALCENSGDVWARAHLRYREIIQSLDLVSRNLERLDPSAQLCVALEDFAPDSIACGIVEGYRGRIVHLCKTDPQVPLYKILDPSFTNWQAWLYDAKRADIRFPDLQQSLIYPTRE